MDERACIAACLICTLAARFRDCQACPFRAGLAVKARQEAIKATIKAAKNSELLQTIEQEIKP